MASGPNVRGWAILIAGIVVFAAMMGMRAELPLSWQRAAVAGIAACILLVAISIWRKTRA